MAIDIVFLLLMVLAAFKGGKRGAIVAIFSLAAMVVGLAAAMKCSQVLASKLSTSLSVSAKWIPAVAFLLILIGVFLCISLLAKLLESAVETIWLGPFNHFLGALIYMVLFTLVFSVALFYLIQLKWVSASTVQESRVFPYIDSWGPWVIDGIGRWIPMFKNLFNDLQVFFGNLSGKLTQ